MIGNAPPGLMKIVVIGEGAVGKTAITIQLTSNHFITEYDPTIENSYRKHMQIDAKEEVLEILDTAGQEEYNSMRESYLRPGQGFLIVFSVTDRTSFQTVPTLFADILRVKETSTFPVVIAANKIDLVEQRDVTHTEARDMAKNLGVPILEVSAKTRTNVEECFACLVREINKANRRRKDADDPAAAEEPYRIQKKKTKCVLF